MKNYSDTDDQEFVKKVLDEFYLLKSLKEAEKFDDNVIKRGFGGSLFGCFFIPVLKIINEFGKKTIKEKTNEKNYTEFEKEANELISQKDINVTICKSIKNLNKNVILTEDKFVEIVCRSLTQNDVRTQFVIPFEPTLFAFIAYIIFQNKLENYCNEI